MVWGDAAPNTARQKNAAAAARAPSWPARLTVESLYLDVSHLQAVSLGGDPYLIDHPQAQLVPLAVNASPEQGNESDPVLVQEVKMFMKANKLSQVTVGQEVQISQPVISQWLSLKYHSYKVRNALTGTPTQRAARVQACLPVPVTR